MKRILSVIMVLIMALGLFACGEKKSDVLPFGLEFGEKYASFCEKLAEYGFDAPELRNATANDGYLSEFIYENFNNETYFDWSFLHSQTLVDSAKLSQEGEDYDYLLSSPGMCFSFNQNKEIYEMYIIFSDVDMYISGKIVPEMIDYFNEEFGINGCPYGFDEEHPASWKNDKLAVEISYSDDKLSIIIHNFEHDLNEQEQ